MHVGAEMVFMVLVKRAGGRRETVTVFMVLRMVCRWLLGPSTSGSQWGLQAHKRRRHGHLPSTCGGSSFALTAVRLWELVGE